VYGSSLLASALIYALSAVRLGEVLREKNELGLLGWNGSTAGGYWTTVLLNSVGFTLLFAPCIVLTALVYFTTRNNAAWFIRTADRHVNGWTVGGTLAGIGALIVGAICVLYGPIPAALQGSEFAVTRNNVSEVIITAEENRTLVCLLASGMLGLLL